MSDEQCSWSFADRSENIIACSVHKNERDVLKPGARKQTLTQLVSQGKWGGRLFNEGEVDSMPGQAQPQPAGEQQALTPAVAPQLPAQRQQSTDLVEYQTPEGQQVSVSLRMFQEMICPQANAGQARYMLNWCAHNKIDPFANEAYFAVMDNKPVIQVSKDCWLRRAERHPKFKYYDSGLIVELSMNEMKSAVIGGTDSDYLVPQAIKDRLLSEAMEGRASDPKGFPARFTVRKRGQYLGDGENLKGGWIEIHRTDQPHPILFQLNLDGWEGQSHFWKEKTGKRPFMMWKSALKNGMRLAFPELSGLIAQKDAPDDFDAAGAADYELKQQDVARTALIQQLHASGSKVPAPCGPFTHDDLHDLAGVLFDGKGITELSMQQLSTFVLQVSNAQIEEEHRNDLRAILDGIRPSESEITAERDESGVYDATVDVDAETGELLSVG